MSNIEELKKQWQCSYSKPSPYNKSTLEKIIKSRVTKHVNMAMQYFWASFVLQMIVYALLCHVLITSWNDAIIMTYCAIGILIYIPFTIVLMKKFKRIAIIKLDDDSANSIHKYVYGHYKLLNSFFTFKKSYELVLIPVSAALGVIIVFQLYTTGGVVGNAIGASVTYILTLLSCYLAIRAENNKNFLKPLEELGKILDEYK